MTQQLNLDRLGHYFTPGNDISRAADGRTYPAGTCQTALVVHSESDGDINEVNLVAWQHDGEQERHLTVMVSAPIAGVATFHLSGACPWLR